MTSFVIVSLLSMFTSFGLCAPLAKLPMELQDEVYLKVPEIIAKYKFPVEVHNIVTDDGYILALHRIPSAGRRPPVLVMHGILASSADFIINGPDHALGYQLAKKGYDVWLGNARGNRYSKNHTRFELDSELFWNFSFHEIGVYDVAAMIDYILGKTGAKQVYHIGHSQGTTALYALLSVKPQYNAKIKAHFAMAPVAFMSHMYSPFMRLLAYSEPAIRYGVKLLGLREFLPQDGFMSTLAQKACDEGELIENICSNVLFAITGYNQKQLNMTMLPLILAHIPAGSSTKQFLHYAQEYNSERFCQYDYGWENLNYYKALEPPNYDLAKIKVPMYFFYSNNDWISSATDVFKLIKLLKTVKGHFLISDDKFDHMDYLFGVDAKSLVYNKIINLMEKH